MRRCYIVRNAGSKLLKILVDAKPGGDTITLILIQDAVYETEIAGADKIYVNEHDAAARGVDSPFEKIGYVGIVKEVMSAGQAVSI